MLDKAVTVIGYVQRVETFTLMIELSPTSTSPPSTKAHLVALSKPHIYLELSEQQQWATAAQNKSLKASIQSRYNDETRISYEFLV